MISLPNGAGSIEGLGPSFEPQLNTGTARHSIALALPPGVSGHRPSLSLSYDSGSGNGPIGIGWSLGIPMIRRQVDKGLPRYTDAAQSGASEDTFMFQGEELVPLSDGAYRAENEIGFMRFRKIASSPGGPTDAWEGVTRQGVRLLFGLASSERVVRPGPSGDAFADAYAWALSSSTDTNGNEILYSYMRFEPESTGVLYLAQIEYARFSASIHHRVVFTYSGSPRFAQARTDVFSDYRSGFEIRTSKLMREIAVFTDGALVRRYVLGFEPHADLTLVAPGDVELGFRFLHTLTQFDRSGGDSNFLPPLRFAYTRFHTETISPAMRERTGRRAMGELPRPQFQALSGGFNFLRFAPAQTEVLDVNSDGLPDFVSTSTNSWFAYLNRGAGEFSDEVPFTTDLADGTDQADGKRLDEDSITLADLDGDGITDIFQKSALSERILTHRNLNGFDAPATLDLGEVVRWGPEEEFSNEFQVGDFGSLAISDPSLRMLDLNFDKRTDVMRPFDLGGGSGGVEYIFNLPRGWVSDLLFVEDERLPPDWVASDARFDGQDPMLRSADLTDLNGDRLIDWYTMAAVGDEIWIDYWPNSNGGFWASRRSTQRLTLPGIGPDELRLMDVNADGLADLVLAENFRLTFWVNIGADRWSDPIVRDDAPNFIAGRTVLRELDVNGNGTTDLFWDNFALDPGSLPPGIETYMYFDFVGETKPNLLVTIDNGHGARTYIEYKSSTTDYLATLAEGQPWTVKLPFPVTVVSRITRTSGLDLDADGEPDEYVTDITYRDGYFDSFEKEFRGFAYAQVIERGDDFDPSTGQTSIGTGSVSGPSLVVVRRFLTGTPDGTDNDDYLEGYSGPRATDEGTGTGGPILAFLDDRGGREEEALKGSVVFEETIDPAILMAAPVENAGFHACARATALAARVDPFGAAAMQCAPDRYVYSRTATRWNVRRLYRPPRCIESTWTVCRW